jgi:hypothetical protein
MCRPFGAVWDNQKYEEYYCKNLLYCSLKEVPYHAAQVAWLDNTNFARPSTWQIGQKLSVPKTTEDGIGKRWICPRQPESPHLARLALLAPKAGEAFYLRALLKHFPARSFDDLYSVSGAAICHLIVALVDCCLQELCVTLIKTLPNALDCLLIAQKLTCASLKHAKQVTCLLHYAAFLFPACKKVPTAVL